MGRNTSVSLGEYFENFVEGEITTGRFKNASEVIRAGLRLLEEEESKITALRKALEAGEKSGIVTDFDPKNFLKSIKARRKKNG